jgi:arabinan endo-1,5-alpha-L-arabinosidase
MRQHGTLMMVAAAMFVACPDLLRAGPINTTGQRDVHDPSRILKVDGRYYVFYTGSSSTRRIRTRTSTNLTSWSSGTDAITTAPQWAAAHVPSASNYWAPDVVFVDGEYHMYYSVSTFGSQQSGIGLRTNPTLNPAAANYAWTDRGAVLTSTNGSAYNAIDPGILLTSTGKMYMSFGSFWNGLYITELNPTTGLRITPNSAVTRIAQNPAGAHPIEAAYLHERDGYFYLFVNYDTCCAGVNSTYNIRVGRSISPTGPFLDKNGVNMINGGGSMFLGTEGTQIGPGHLSIFEENGQEIFTYHYYDGGANGAARLNWRSLAWASNGWPVIADTLPEPATPLLLVAGALAAGGRMRRRHASR